MPVKSWSHLKFGRKAELEMRKFNVQDVCWRWHASVQDPSPPIIDWGKRTDSQCIFRGMLASTFLFKFVNKQNWHIWGAEILWFAVPLLLHTWQFVVPLLLLMSMGLFSLMELSLLSVFRKCLKVSLFDLCIAFLRSNLIRLLHPG